MAVFELLSFLKRFIPLALFGVIILIGTFIALPLARLSLALYEKFRS